MEKLTIENDDCDISFRVYESIKEIEIELDPFDGTTNTFLTKEQAEKLITWLQLAVKELAQYGT